MMPNPWLRYMNLHPDGPEKIVTNEHLEEALRKLRRCSYDTEERISINETLAEGADELRVQLYALLTAVQEEWKELQHVRKYFIDPSQPHGRVDSAAVKISQLISGVHAEVTE